MMQSGPPPCTQMLCMHLSTYCRTSEWLHAPRPRYTLLGIYPCLSIKLILRGRITTSRIPYQLGHYTHTLHKPHRHQTNTHLPCPISPPSSLLSLPLLSLSLFSLSVPLAVDRGIEVSVAKCFKRRGGVQEVWEACKRHHLS